MGKNTGSRGVKPGLYAVITSIICTFSIVSSTSFSAKVYGNNGKVWLINPNNGEVMDFDREMAGTAMAVGFYPATKEQADAAIKQKLAEEKEVERKKRVAMWFLLFGLGIASIPVIIAYRRKHRYWGIIALLILSGVVAMFNSGNAIVGFGFWVASFAWAIWPDKSRAPSSPASDG